MLVNFWNDEVGAIVSIEIILIITIAVISLVVGWSEVAHAVNTELDDISNAVGKLNQSYFYGGFHSYKDTNGRHALKAVYYGSAYNDRRDDCDGNCSGRSDITCCAVVTEQWGSICAFQIRGGHSKWLTNHRTGEKQNLNEDEDAAVIEYWTGSPTRNHQFDLAQ